MLDIKDQKKIVILNIAESSVILDIIRMSIESTNEAIKLNSGEIPLKTLKLILNNKDKLFKNLYKQIYTEDSYNEINKYLEIFNTDIKNNNSNT